MLPHLGSEMAAKKTDQSGGKSLKIPWPRLRYGLTRCGRSRGRARKSWCRMAFKAEIAVRGDSREVVKKK